MKEGKIEGIGGRQGRRKAGKIHVRRERGTPVLFCSASFSSFRDFFLFLPKIRGGGSPAAPPARSAPGCNPPLLAGSCSLITSAVSSNF